MDALADGLEDLDVDGRRAPVVPVVLVLVVADDPVRALDRGERGRRLARDARDDRARVQRQDGRVRVDRVRVQQPRERERPQERRRQVRRERVFVRAADERFSAG